jgi:hypothetical protein
MASLKEDLAGSEEVDLGGEGVDDVVKLTNRFKEQVALSLDKSDPDSDILSKKLTALTLARLAAIAQIFFSGKNSSQNQPAVALAKTA